MTVSANNNDLAAYVPKMQKAGILAAQNLTGTALGRANAAKFEIAQVIERVPAAHPLGSAAAEALAEVEELLGLAGPLRLYIQQAAGFATGRGWDTPGAAGALARYSEGCARRCTSYLAGIAGIEHLAATIIRLDEAAGLCPNQALRNRLTFLRRALGELADARSVFEVHTLLDEPLPEAMATAYVRAVAHQTAAGTLVTDAALTTQETAPERFDWLIPQVLASTAESYTRAAELRRFVGDDAVAERLTLAAQEFSAAGNSVELH